MLRNVTVQQVSSHPQDVGIPEEKGAATVISKAENYHLQWSLPIEEERPTIMYREEAQNVHRVPNSNMQRAVTVSSSRGIHGVPTMATVA